MQRPMRSFAIVARFGAISGCVLACATGTTDPSSDDPEAPPAEIYANDTSIPSGFVPNPAFHPLPSGDALGFKRSALRVESEVIILEGDPRFVSSNGASYGITQDNQVAIVQAVLAEYPDVFDTIQIYLSFLDQAHAGSAYYQSIRNDVAGVGIQSFNGRGGWGLPADGRLSGFSNMNVIDQFGPLNLAGVARSHYHAVIAQELSHRWLMFLKLKDPTTGMENSSLLGRMDAHWSKLVQAYGSVQDGIYWKDNGDGTFSNMGVDLGYAPIDLYAMGIFRKEQVPDFYYLVEASFEGMPLNKTSPIPFGAKVSGRKIPVTVDQVIAQMGPRNPPQGTETPYYRAALVLLTQPGQAQAEWQPYLDALKRIRETLPESWKSWTLKSGAICTKVTERCPEPNIGLDRFAIHDGGDDLLAPGERFDLLATVRNDGIGTAENVAVSLRAKTPGVEVMTGTITAAAIPEAGTAALPMPFSVRLGSNLACGSVVAFTLRAASQEGPAFTDDLDFVIGNRTVRIDPLDEGPDWHVNPDGNDTATAGAWELAEPEFVSALGVLTQPRHDHTAGDGKLAFVTGARRGALFSSNDVDGGKTVLESPVFAVGETRDPTLVFYAWHVALNFADPAGPSAVAGSALTVLGSNDGGATWVELQKIEDTTQQWTRVSIPLRDHLEPSNRMRFRFVVADPSMSGTVEAAIDDLELIDILPECPARNTGVDAGVVAGDAGQVERPQMASGCGCTMAGGADVSASGLLMLFGLVLARRRARRSPRP